MNGVLYLSMTGRLVFEDYLILLRGKLRVERDGIVSKKSMARATTIVMVLGIISKIMGFVREQLIAWFFGATGPTDAYMVALAIPTVLVGLISNPISTTFVPVFTSYLNSGDRKNASRVASSVITLSVGTFFIIGVVSIPFAPALVRIYAPGFSSELFGSAVALTRLFFPAFALPLLAALLKAILNSHKEFTIPGVGPFVQNLTIVALVALLAPKMGLFALAIATIAGYLAHVLVQVPAVRKTGLELRFSTEVNEGMRKVLSLSLPLVLGGLATQMCLMVDKNLASRLPSGSISALGFADRLRSLPMDLFIAAVVTVIYPSLSEMWARRDKSGMGDTLLTGIRYAMFLCIPSAIGLIVLSQPLVRLAFERGAFTSQATLLTASAVSVYSVGIVSMALSRLIGVAFYSTQDTWRPVLLALATSGLNILLNFAFVQPLGHIGLALANVISTWVGAMIGIWMYTKYISGFSVRDLIRSSLKIVLCSVLMGAFAWIGAYYSGLMAGTGSAQKDLLLAILVIGGSVLVYLVSALVFECEEIVLVRGIFRDKLSHRKDV